MIMKSMIFILSLISFISGEVYSQKMKGFSRNEKQFVKNVIKVQNEEPVEITKRKDNFIVVEFSTTMVVLKPDGFVDEVWIRTDEDWLSLGREENAY